MLRIPTNISKNVTYKLAETQDELEQAFRLLHDCYVERGLMSPHPSGLRCTLFSTLPYTSILIAKYKDRVMGTVSLIKDSPLGLPSDSDFRDENNQLRKREFKLVEVSAFAIHEKYRKKSSIVNYYMMKYLVEYALKHISSDTLVATAHPRGMDLYEALFDFKLSSRVVSYEYVNGAPAAHGYLHFDPEYWAHLKFALYKNRGPRRSFVSFYREAKGPFQFPPPLPIQNMPVMTVEMLRYFFIEKTDLFHLISHSDLVRVLSIYNLYFDTNALGIPIKPTDRHAFRFQTEIHAAIATEREFFFGTICDLSTGGVYFSTEELLELGKTYTLYFKINSESFKVQATPRWKNDSPEDYRPMGYGLQFSSVNKKIAAFLRSMHLSFFYPGAKATAKFSLPPEKKAS